MKHVIIKFNFDEKVDEYYSGDSDTFLEYKNMEVLESTLDDEDKIDISETMFQSDYFTGEWIYEVFDKISE